MQWVKERLAYAGTSILGINGVQNGSPSLGHRTPVGSRAFSRNDSSNSNTSGSQYSGTATDYSGYPFTPPRTPPPPKTPPPTSCRASTPSTPAKNGVAGKTDSGSSYFTFNLPSASATRAQNPPTRFAHLKLTPKNSGTGSLGTPASLNGGLSNCHIDQGNSTSTSANSSLRRQRFRQNHNSRFESRRRLSKTSSTGTASYGSTEHSLAPSTSLLANPIVDRLLDYVRDNYVNTMDPFNWEINRKFRLTSFGKLAIFY